MRPWVAGARKEVDLRSLLRALLIFLPLLATAQPFYNLDFEVVTRGRLRGWAVNAAGYELSADSTQFTSGRYSARIRNTGAPDTGLGPTAVLLPLNLVRGRRLKITGQMKTEAVTPGYAAIWLRVDGPDNRSISLDNMSESGPRGSTDWTLYTIEREVAPSAINVVFGFFLAGAGTAWFDDLRIEIDGVPIAQNAPFGGEPTESQLEWLRANSVPFRTERAGSGFDDLQPLRSVIGKARVVALGEATHGTAEFFRMKHRMLEWLATEMGFTIFSIEANMPESYRMNDYVLTGRGNPRELLRGMYFWTWQTEEVLAMVEWMRQFNASGKGRVQFTGFDMQTWTVAGDVVRRFVERADPEYLATLDDAYQLVRETRSLPANAANLARLSAASEAAQKVKLYLEAKWKQYVNQYELADVDWAVQNARVVEQAAHLPIGGSLHRDEMMALNTRWILSQNPDAKAVLWAHNYHVSRVPGAQGSHLSAWYGADYVIFGFAFHEGSYTAVTALPGGRTGPLATHVATVSYPGSVEYMLHSTGMPRFILDLRKAKADNAGSWLLTGMEFREIGALQTDGFAIRNSLTNDYDALIFFDQTVSSVLLQ